MSSDSPVNESDSKQVVSLPEQTSYEPLKGMSFYGAWDHRVNPKMWIEKKYNTLGCCIDDERSYDSLRVIDHLTKVGAVCIEQMSNLNGLVKQEDNLSPWEDDANDRGYKLYWHRGFLVSLDLRRDGVTLLETYGPMSEATKVRAVHEEFAPFLVPSRGDARVSILLQSTHGLKVKEIDFEAPVIEDLGLNYGEGFKAIDNQIVHKLTTAKAGLILFHGAPGTGKSTYIKHLTSRIDREFIFIPVGMAGELSSPSFLNLLLDHEKAILVLEDAEQALQSRETDHWNSSTIATLLNLTDGLLGTLLNITVIATYNADKQTIDKALLRKGRLAFDYTFDKLSVEDARRMATYLKKNANLITEPTSLADIYNAEDNTGYVEPVKKTMGFGFGVVASSG